MQRKKLMELHINKRRGDVPDVPQKDGWKAVRCYDAFVDDSTGEKVLIVDFFEPQTDTFIKRLFFNGDKWFSVLNDGSTSESSIRLYWSGESYVPFSKDASYVIKQYLSKLNILGRSDFTTGTAISLLSGVQDKIRDNRLEVKYQRIKDSISREMLEITPTPDKFIQWVDKELMPKYLFYIYSKTKRVEAHCSFCGETVTIERPHKDDVVKCPHCRQTCTAKPLRLHNNSAGFNDKMDAVIYLQPLKNNRMCIRKYCVFFRYYSANTKPVKEYFERERRFARLVKGSFVEESTYTSESNYRGGDWRREYYTSSAKGKIYPSTLNQIFKKREGFKQYHIDYNKIARKCGTVNVAKLLYASENVNSLMNLVNAGLYSMAHDVIDLARVSGVNIREGIKNVHYINSGALKKAFGITKDDLPYLKHVDPTLEQYDAYVKLKESGKVPAPAELKRFFQICSIMNVGSGKFKMLIDYLIQYSTVHQFVKYYDYLQESKYFHWENSCEHYFYGGKPEIYFLSDYFDYIDFAKLLEMNLRDLNVLYPRDFKKAHDSLSDIVNSKEFKAAELPQIARQHDKYNQMFGYAYKGLLIVPPKRHNDIKKEGEILKHCVATYSKRVATGETIILFVRKESEPDKPYFTLNIEPGTYEFIQCRGLKNCQYPNEVKVLLARWYQEKIEPLRRNQQTCLKTA